MAFPGKSLFLCLRLCPTAPLCATRPFHTVHRHHRNDPSLQISNKALSRFHTILYSAPSLPNRILITGAMGQIGRSLASVLANVLGPDRLLLSDICSQSDQFVHQQNNEYTPTYRFLDILDKSAIEQIVVDERIDTIVHLSALLSAIGEQNVERALQVNCQGVQNVLQVANAHRLKLFVPSTIGVFGQFTPRTLTPDITIQRPSTIYGVSKVFGELLGDYYCSRFGVDFRSVRLPGIISMVQPGGGTTDYAIQMFWDALHNGGRHICYLRPDTKLPMMFGEDCMAALIGILVAPSARLRLRTYNVAGFSCTPAQLALAIRKHLPNFQIHYDICPIRQRIADSWPQSLDDGCARADWGWCPQFTLEGTVEEMLAEMEKMGKAKGEVEEDEEEEGEEQICLLPSMMGKEMGKKAQMM